jgi:hypothetical protein
MDGGWSADGPLADRRVTAQASQEVPGRAGESLATPLPCCPGRGPPPPLRCPGLALDHPHAVEREGEAEAVHGESLITPVAISK